MARNEVLASNTRYVYNSTPQLFNTLRDLNKEDINAVQKNVDALQERIAQLEKENDILRRKLRHATLLQRRA